jgi:hypothetical protein
MEARMRFLYLAGDQEIGGLEMVAQNAMGGTAKEMSQANPEGYKLIGNMWPKSIHMVLSLDDLPAIKGATTKDDTIRMVSEAISEAQATWDGNTSKDLFSTLGTITKDDHTFNRDFSKYGTRDGHNGHVWTKDRLFPNTAIAGTMV